MSSSDYPNYVKRSNNVDSPEYAIPSAIVDLMEKELNCVTGGRAQHGLRWEHKGVGVVFLEQIQKNTVTIYILPTKACNWRTQKVLAKLFLENNLSHLNEKIVEKGEGKHVRINNLSWDDAINTLPILVNWGYSSQTGKSFISNPQAIQPESSPNATYEYLPTRSDCERVIKQLRHETSRQEFSIPGILDRLELNLINSGRKLRENWRSVTENNLRNWYS